MEQFIFMKWKPHVADTKEEADGSGDALLFEGARAGLLDVVEYVLESNVSLDVTNDQGETAGTECGTSPWRDPSFRFFWPTPWDRTCP